MGNGLSPVSDILSGIIKNAQERNPVEEVDYIGEDGLVYCGKCNTRRQSRIVMLGNQVVVPVMCKCREEEVEKQKVLEKLENIKKLKKDSLIDEKFLSCTFDTIEVTKDNKRQLKICKRYAEKFDELFEKNQGLLLYGAVGTGKTHFACCIGNYLMDNLTTVYATSLVKILSQARAFKSNDDEEAYIRKMNRAKLLIIDDLGAESGSDYALEVVYNVIDSRYRTGRPMIVTTNKMLSDMQTASDIKYKRIYDRILEVCYPVEFVGRSWRMKEAANRFDEMKSLLED